MALGAAVRRRLGPLERPASNAYRGYFINLEDLAATLAVLRPRRILEVGCGEGAVAERLLPKLNGASYVGIDISAVPGGGYAGPADGVEFRRVALEEYADEGHDPFDLVLFVDVLHHVPPGERPALLATAARVVAPGGVLAVKDWERSLSVRHAAVIVADRFIGGEQVAFFRPGGITELLAPVLTGADAELVCDARIPPHRSNRLVAYRLGRSD